MKSNLRVSFALVMILALLLSTSLSGAAKSNYAAAFSSIDFVPNIETIGVAVSGTSFPSTAQLSYRQSGESVWHTGHYLVRINDGRLIGSLFNLAPATSYDVKVSDGVSEISGSVSTQTDELSFTPSTILNVDNSASPGGNGSASAPFQTIQDAVNHAGPGTQILVADGVYREAVTFPNSGTPGNWIQVKAAGNAAILDSADRLSGNIWTLSSTSHVWFKKISFPVAYLARDEKRYYQYDDRTGMLQGLGHGGVSIQEGWFYEPSTLRLYVRSLDNPANHTWQVPRLNHAFDVAAHDWIWIEGFETRFYGTTTNGCGVCTLNASHLVIRNNNTHNMQLGIFVNWNGTADQGNDARIEGNEVSDPKTAAWPWASVKGSYMEGTGILVRSHIGAIVRENTVHDFFNGIFTGSSATGVSENPEFAFDVDVYRNYIHHIMDDALEPEGACVNNRFRGNTIDKAFVGFSIAPITVGPTWFLRNAFANFTGRGIKFADNSAGTVFIYHNTGWTTAANINGADLITPIHNVVMRNNIFQTAAYSFSEVPTGSTANDWNYDDWYTTRGSTGPHFKWENINYNTMPALCTARGLECNGHEVVPGFVNPTGGDFTLLSSSPNIDRGILIPGINDDYFGNAPDVGAYEYESTFMDVPPSHPFWRYIEAFYKAGITTGCSQSPKMYCPDNLVTRGEMAVFIERAKGNFNPQPNPSGMFADMPYLTFTSFIEQFYNDGITTGCAQNPLMYCPTNNVTRGEMAVFIERAIGHFNPQPNPSGMFADMPYLTFTPFIEQFYNDGITTGCAQDPLKYCPANNVTRAEMAVFIVRAFHIPLP